MQGPIQRVRPMGHWFSLRSTNPSMHRISSPTRGSSAQPLSLPFKDSRRSASAAGAHNRCRSASGAHPCNSSHFCFDAARTKPSTLPRKLPLTAPISCKEKRYRSFQPGQRAGLVIISAVERMGEDFFAEFTAISRQLFVRERLGFADKLTANAAGGAPSPSPHTARSLPACRTDSPRKCKECRHGASCRDTNRQRLPECAWPRGAAAEAMPPCHFVITS